jgi:hypothetical protein
MRKKKINIIVLAYLALIVSLAAEHSKAVPEIAILKAFRSLKEGSSLELVDNNLAAIRAGGVSALLVLVTQLDNTEIAHSCFESTNSVVIDSISDEVTGKMKTVALGKVAFDLIQEIVEGQVPWGYREYFLLNPNNAKDWILSRKTKSLIELQIEAAEVTLKKALKMQREDQSEFSRKFVEFSKLRLERVRKSSASSPK